MYIYIHMYTYAYTHINVYIRTYISALEMVRDVRGVYKKNFRKTSLGLDKKYSVKSNVFEYEFE